MEIFPRFSQILPATEIQKFSNMIFCSGCRIITWR